LGDLDAGQLDPVWSAAALDLQAGEISGVIDARGKYFIIQRMPRNFREDAAAHFKKAMELRKQGDRQQSAAELLEALRRYPRFLRALTYLAVTYAESGSPQTAAGILNAALRSYSDDAGAHFNLGIVYGAMHNTDEIAEYRKVLELDPDFVLGYLNLGAALYDRGQYEEALHYSLSLALTKEERVQEAESEMALAVKIDPKAANQ